MTHLRPRRAILLLPAAIALAACARTPASPDPGNRRLHALAADPVFAVLSPGAVRTSWREDPAKYRNEGPFGPQTWDGPDVIMTFTSARSVRDVYDFYAERARGAGWTPWSKLTEGFTDIWVRDIAGHKSFIQLLPKDFDNHSVDVTESGIPRSYSLTGST
ncbi:MAG: hypothetical protein J2P57_14575 [Acidimicrobiaceae bacterium]|nr:hypothetical protein [Acidimicrobiaceae bacterium]